jgi:hypothetical protein
VHAAELEKNAQFPRIVVGPRVLESLDGWRVFLQRDSDGVVYYDFLRHVWGMMVATVELPRGAIERIERV